MLTKQFSKADCLGSLTFFLYFKSSQLETKKEKAGTKYSLVYSYRRVHFMSNPIITILSHKALCFHFIVLLLASCYISCFPM